MSYFDELLAQSARIMFETLTENEEEKEKVDYRKLPYIKVNMIKAKHIEPVKTEKEKAKEWRVRKENIDKIKLPVFCSFDLNDGRPRRLGILVNSRYKTDLDIISKVGISLYEVDKQTGVMVGDRIDSMCFSPDKETTKRGLETLINMYNINLGKVEINFYE